MTTEAKKRKFHTAEFQVKVGLQALAAEKTINELAQQRKVHPVSVRQWKAEIQAQPHGLSAAGNARVNTQRGCHRRPAGG